MESTRYRFKVQLFPYYHCFLGEAPLPNRTSVLSSVEMASKKEIFHRVDLRIKKEHVCEAPGSGLGFGGDEWSEKAGPKDRAGLLTLE